MRSKKEYQETQKYNGWANYETWAVNLWLTNDEESYNKAQRVVDESEDENEAAENLKEYIENLKRKLYLFIDNANLFSDLLNAAISEVNWHEIAQAFMDEK